MTTARVRAGYALFSALLPIHIALYTLAEPRSTSFLVLAGLLSVFSLAGIAATLTLPRWLETARRWLGRAHLPYLVLTLIICVAFGIQARPEWIYTHAGLWLATTLVLGYGLIYAGLPSIPPRRIGVVLVISAFTMVAIRLVGLSIYPARTVIDEPWEMGWLMSYVHTGQLTDRIMFLGGYELPPFMILPGLWIKLFGEGFWQARTFFFLCVLLLTGVTAMAAYRLYDQRVALLAGVFMFSSTLVMLGARIRHDIGLALAVAASLWAFAEAIRRQKDMLHFLAGLLIGLGIFAHYHAVILGPIAAVGCYLPRWLGGIRSHRGLPERGFWLFVTGGGIVAVVFFLLQILPNLQESIVVNSLRLAVSFEHYLQAAIGYIGVIIQFSRFEFVLIVAAAGAALWRRSSIDQTLVITLVLAHLLLAGVAAVIILDYYLVPLTPIYGILIAALFGRGLRRERDFSEATPFRIRLIAGLAVAALCVGVTLYEPLKHLLERRPVQIQPNEAMVWLRQNVPADRTITAQHWYYLFLLDRPYISPISGEMLSNEERAVYQTDEQLWDTIMPDYVVLDPNFSDFCYGIVICQDTYLEARGYEIVAEFPGERESITIYASSDAREEQS